MIPFYDSQTSYEKGYTAIIKDYELTYEYKLYPLRYALDITEILKSKKHVKQLVDILYEEYENITQDIIPDCILVFPSTWHRYTAFSRWDNRFSIIPEYIVMQYYKISYFLTPLKVFLSIMERRES